MPTRKPEEPRFWNGVYMLFGASFILSLVKTGSGDAQSAYFLLPSRAWELLAGSIISRISIRSDSPNRHVNVFLSLGLGLILFPYVCFDDNTLFPGLGALPSVAGACLLIVYGGHWWHGSVIEKALARVGKASYSLYLWHWPVFILFEAAYSPAGAVAGVGVTILATVLSYRFIELPIRKWKSFGAGRAFPFLIASSGILLAFCFWVLAKKDIQGEIAKKWNGRDTWFVAELKRDQGRSETSLEELKSGAKLIPIGAEKGHPWFVVWGDSHALALLPGFDHVAKDHTQAGYFLNLKHGLGMKSNIGGYAFDPIRDRESVLRWLETSPDIVDIYLVNFWFRQLAGREDLAAVVRICERLKRAGKNPYFFRNLPLSNEKALGSLQWGLGVDPAWCRFKVADYNRQSALQDELTAILAGRGLATVIEIDKAFLAGDYITVAPPISYYMDSHHVNAIGAIRAVRFVAPTLWPSQ